MLHEGPADRAGIRPGDVQVTVNDKPVADSASLLNLIAALPPGQTAVPGLIRRQRPIQITAKVERRPLMQRSQKEE